MFHGFYNLASGMITQNRNLSVISNNLVNVNTPGYKFETMTSTTFQEEMMAVNEELGRGDQAEIGPVNMVVAPEQTITNFAQGAPNQTGNPMDFFINGDGFFQIETTTGNVYTRNGSFGVDEQSYLILPGVGRVQGQSGPIFLESDEVQYDSAGGIYDAEGELIDYIQIVDFPNYETLTRSENGIFTTQEQPLILEATNVVSGMLESSNVDMRKQMENMIITQRSFESSSQVLKMYDQMMSLAANQIAKI